MKGKLEQIKKEFQKEIEAVKSLADLEILDNKYLGRKSGALTSAMKELKSLAKEEIPKMGQLANEVKIFLTGEFEKTKKKLKSQDQISGSFDPTLPGTEQPIGHLHLVSQAIREISSIFEHIGFQRARYPEVEWDYYAFEALNMPISHPARDEWETFFIDQDRKSVV